MSPARRKPGRPAATPSRAARDDRPVRLQKFMARAGIGSRRSCETLIAEGRVTVDGQTVTTPGTSVDPLRQKIAVDGQMLREQRPVYLALHKPPGYVCSSRRQGQAPGILELLPASNERLFCIGRLDKDSEGLILVTNDGDLCQHVAHPRHEVPKTYRVVVKGPADPESLVKLREGVWLAEGRTAPASLKITRRTRERTTLLITLREGKNRHIRRILARVGLRVRTLERVRIGPVCLRRLRAGCFRRLTRQELTGLWQGEPAAGPRSRTAAKAGGKASPKRRSRSSAAPARAKSKTGPARPTPAKKAPARPARPRRGARRTGRSGR